MILRLFFFAILFGLFITDLASLTLPLREVVRISTLRENQLVGYGLVVGLPQTGDSRSPLAIDALRKVLSYRGIDLPERGFEARNIAAVMVMARVPAFARPGDPIDIWVSSIGDARSLQGGFLLQTPLAAADGVIYAAAQAGMPGKLDDTSFGEDDSAGQYPFRNRRNTFRRNQHDRQNTVFIPGGAIMEKEVRQDFWVTDVNNPAVKYIRLSLLHFDVNTAKNLLEVINARFPNAAALENSGTLVVRLPDGAEPVKFVAELFNLPVEVQTKAKVVIDPRSGTVVMGGGVGLSKVAVTKNNIRITVKGSDEKTKVAGQVLEEAPTVQELMDGLNRLGLSAADIIDIMKAIHAAGALHAELVIL